jgi:hypothetical protein
MPTIHTLHMKQRYNITLTPEMDEKLNQYAYQARKSRSTIIEEALEQYLSGSVNEPLPLRSDEISLLNERMAIIESKLRNMETKNYTCPEICQSVNENCADISSPVVGGIPKKNSPEDLHQKSSNYSDSHATIGLDPEGWYSQSLVAEFLDPSILFITRKSIVSMAVARGEMETNGKKRKGCRIKGSSVIRWITSMRRKEKPPIFFLGSS